jgi:hypothetical protein
MVFNNNPDTINNNGLLESLDMGNSVYCAGNTAHNYIYEGAYESYIQNKISNEQRLAAMIDSRISTKIESAIVLEAKAGDKLKSKWNKLVEFIKGICAKFMETMSNVLLDQKDYLEKYKDIILKKKPKEDLKYSYTGDYELGIQRLIKIECPIFNYANHSAELKQEGDGAITTKVMKGAGASDFTFDDGETLAEQLKAYFTASDKGQSEGTFSNLNMTDIYNFCYNFDQIKKIVDKDQKHLEQSTAAIDAAIKEEIRKSGENTNTNQTDNAQQQTQSTGDSGGEKKGEEATGESYSLLPRNRRSVLEADDANNTNGGGNDNKSQGLKITDTGTTKNSNAVSQMSSYGNDGNKKNITDDEAKKNADGGAAGAMQDANGDQSEAINSVTKMTDKWIKVCRALITSKLTACEQISRDYMEIIRAHVRSYGGKDLKNKETDKATQTATNYRKPSNNGGNAENNNQNTNTNQNTNNNQDQNTSAGGKKSSQ